MIHSTQANKILEPIAIIGLGCRLPGGVNDWSAFWHLLDSSVDAITETPNERWNLQKFYSAESCPGKTQSKWGGYVDRIDQFDPQLFGISPREASSMDPQQRMLLEVAFRALEDAGQPLERVAGRNVSVFVGISSIDYAVANLSYRDRGVIDAYSNTGGSSSIAANRISYCFDLRGPSVAVDTACSSSLVAVHMACESLWRGEATMAMAGGVNALILPDFYVAFSRLGVLAPDGRCKTFDARANGYVRSEGAGMVLLKPLSAALRDKDPIYATIRATALNQDGRTPGMTVPSQAAQQSLILTACNKAGIQPAQVQYVEAHGTGTAVGDPIEAAALARALGDGRSRENPCLVGSVKTNIGHLEAGAGIASLLKVALALHHRRIPGNLHFKTPNPAIDFDSLGLRVPTRSEDWLSNGSKRLAGINGFGYGGANAHVILEEAPEQALKYHAASSNAPQPANSIRGAKVGFEAPVLMPLSARTHTAVKQAAARLAAWLGDKGSQFHLAEVAGFLAHRRSHHSIRSAVCASTHAEMISQLQVLADASDHDVADNTSGARLAGGMAFVCCGQGPQWWAMGRGLIKYSPAFRGTIKRCDDEFSKYGEWSLLEELTGSETASRMQQTSIAQPSIFALQVALAEMWQSWGIKPSAIVGHSVGEIAAAYLSGALSWEHACCVAFHRGRTMDLATSQGAMLAAGLSPEEVPEWIAGIEDKVALAAVNGPTSVTISGAATAIEPLAQRLEAKGVFCRRLAVEYAFHSPQMEPVRSALLQSLANIKPMKTHTTWISTVTGEAISGMEVDAEYWWKNVRQSVRFSDAMACLAELGCGLAVELGPHPVLAYAINECFQAAGHSVRTVPSLNRHQDDLTCISKSLGSLYSLGCDIHWSGFYNQPTRKLPVPNYPFQTQRCWSESLDSRMSRLAVEEHPLLGDATLGCSTSWQQRIDLQSHGYLPDHRVRETVVYPAAAMIETAIAAARSSTQSATARLQRIRLHSPCVLEAERPQWIETSVAADRQQISLNYRDCDQAEWSALATMDISTRPLRTPEEFNDFSAHIEAIQARCVESFSRSRLYDYCKSLGLQYGEAFQGVRSGLCCPGEALVEVSLPVSCVEQSANYNLHPSLLDSCFHAMIAADHNFDHTLDGLYLPSEIKEINFFRPAGEHVVVHARLLHKTKQIMVCDLDVFNPQGDLCLTIKHFESRRVSTGVAAEETKDLIYGYTWVERPLSADIEREPGQPATWLLFMDEGHVGRELVQRLRFQGDQVIEIYREHSHVPKSGVDSFLQVNPESRDSFAALIDSALLGAKQPQRIVYLWGLDAPDSEQLNVETLEQSTQLTTLAPLHLVQAWELDDNSPRVPLAIVTSGAQSQDGSPTKTSVAQSPLLGFGRVVISESSKLETKLIDLPTKPLASDIDNLFAELLAVDEEDEVMWRDGCRFGHRFLPTANTNVSVDAAQQLPCELRVGKAAGIEELHYATKPACELAAGQVEIEVLASGLNFSDVMKALDLYPGLPDGPIILGAECSGRIARVGPSCQCKVGDEVIAVAPGSFATHIVVHESLVAPKPTNLTHAQAAAIPIAFLTADYALNHCARLQRGESLLIHSASGGVGLAAMQLAAIAGVRVLATAGSEEKRSFVRELGAAVVMDSRSLAFGDETLRATNDEGVDAVLNSLPGEAIKTGLSVLKSGGKFLEIGKRDIYNDASLGLYPFRNNLALFAIDLDQLFTQQPHKMGTMLRKLVERFETGELKPLPTQSYAASETVAAFRFMQQSKHIGKVVVEYTEHPSDIRAGEYAPIAFDNCGTYWIAGGLGGFGMEIVRWLFERGARTFALSGRSTTVRPETQAYVDELIGRGARISILPADISQASEVASVLARIDEELPRLRGVFHTAMVLEDKLLVDLDRWTLERVLKPKVLGGWNLHEQTANRDLDHFVLFSSLSSVFGHAGQANYAAANAMLDSLAYHRRAQGLPAVVINWGHLGEVGYLAQREELGQRLERQGVLSFSVKQATDCLEYALQTLAIQQSVLRIDWSVWRGLGITNRVSPRFSHLLRQRNEFMPGSENTMASAEHLRLAVGAERGQLVDDLLRSKVAGLLGIPVDEILGDRALLEMGLDSLMAVEMRNWIESQMEINLPISALMRSEGLSDLCNQVCGIIEGTVAEGTLPIQDSVTEADAVELLENLPNLGADEVSDLLRQLLVGEQP